MFIVCDQCLTKFKVKKGAIKSNGRIVRCGNCEYEWIALPKDLQSLYKLRLPKSLYIPLFIIIFTFIFTIFALFLRNDEKFSFLQLNNHEFLTVENLDTTFYKEEHNSFAIVKAKITNSATTIENLNSILIVIESRHGQKVKVLDKINVAIMPHKSIIIPFKVDKVDSDVVKIKAYLGGRNLMLFRQIFL